MHHHELVDQVHRLLMDNLPLNSGKTPSGWTTFNCPMCSDKRKRGGVIQSNAKIIEGDILMNGSNIVNLSEKDFQQIIIIGFFIFLLKTSNPFNYILPVPKEGLGLNPILQDPALAIHPPILYLGYVGSSIIFSSTLFAFFMYIV